MPLTDQLVAFWELETTIGLDHDATGNGNDLTATNNPTHVDGLVGKCLQFQASLSQADTCTDNVFLEIPPGTPFTFAFWYWINNATDPMTFLAKSRIVGGNGVSEYYLDITPGAPGVRLVNDTNETLPCINNNNGASTPNQWNFCAGGYDGSANLFLQINNGTLVTSGLTPARQSALVAGSSFFLARRDGQSVYLDGKLDQVGFWKRKLTTAELTYLYNGGAGRTYAQVATYGGSGRRGTIGSSIIVAGGL